MDQVIRLEVIQNVIVYQALFYRRETASNTPGLKHLQLKLNQYN